MTIINILELLDIREEWVNAYFLDMIARLVTQSTHTQLDDSELYMLEVARHKVIEHHMHHVAAGQERPRFTLIEGGKVKGDTIHT